MSARIGVYLDIDGVLSIPYEGMSDDAWLPWGDYHAAPVPMWQHLIRALSTDPRLDCHWLTNWEDSAWYWNKAAGVGLWATLCHPTAWARRMYPECFEKTAQGLWRPTQHWKLIALRYHLRRHHAGRAAPPPVVWIEDGFAPETISYAAGHPTWRLVDTRYDHIREALLAEPGTMQQARAFIERHVMPIAT